MMLRLANSPAHPHIVIAGLDPAIHGAAASSCSTRGCTPASSAGITGENRVYSAVRHGKRVADTAPHVRRLDQAVRARLCEVPVEVAPVGIVRLYQSDLPGARPFLEILFPLYSGT